MSDGRAALRDAVSRYMPLKTAADFCDDNARRIVEKEALVDARRRLTWGQVAELSDALALGLLDLGLERDGHVLIQMPNSAELFLARLACEKAGLRLVTVAPSLRRAELELIVRFTRPKVAIIPAAYRGVQPCRAAGAGPSSGVAPCAGGLGRGSGRLSIPGRNFGRGGSRGTASPPFRHPLRRRGRLPARHHQRLHGHTQVRGRAPLHASSHRLVPPPAFPRGCRRYPVRGHRDHFGVADGLVYNGVCEAGARVVLLDHFDPRDTCETVARERVNVLPMVPTMISRLLALKELEDYDFGSLRIIVSHGSPLPHDVGRAAEARLGCRIMQGYGSVDCGGLCATSWDDPPDVRIGSVGRPLEGNEMRIMDASGHEAPRGETGRLWVRGLPSDARFFDNPDLNARRRADGFLGPAGVGPHGRARQHLPHGPGSGPHHPRRAEHLSGGHREPASASRQGARGRGGGLRRPRNGRAYRRLRGPGERRLIDPGGGEGVLAGPGAGPLQAPRPAGVGGRFSQVASGDKVDKRALRESLS